MAERSYTASLSRTQGRSGYSVIFRHPARRDKATGKPGVRVRRGLGTRDKEEAEDLRNELNVLLRDPKYHRPAARAATEAQFDSRVVDIFFDKMHPEETDFYALREDVIPLPESGADGYRHVLFLGTTGAGKTTLVRQLIGTDPKKERFPSTSTARTTIHDTEIILAEGDWRAVVTFTLRDEVREHLTECMSSAMLSAAKGADDAEVLRRLLNHVSQRFRFSYVLGNGPAAASGFSDFDDIEEESEFETDPPNGEGRDTIDLVATNELLRRTTEKLRQLAYGLQARVRADLDVSGAEDERVADEIYEEELDKLLLAEQEFHQMADALMDEIEKRFGLLPPGKVKKTRQGWPIEWAGEWPVEKRAEFLHAISCFSSNYAPRFGRLLTPLVNGVRVAGPFSPKWNGNEVPKFVLIDGEGLGHTPKSSSAVSTSVSRRIGDADAVLLVDNAAQPMQAAPQAAMREVLSTGNVRKLIFAFTQFDRVEGDNLPNVSAKAQHVLAAAENVLRALGEEFGPNAERVLRKRLKIARFFLADLHEPLREESASGRRTIVQLRKLLLVIDKAIEPLRPAEARPVYDRMNLVLAISSAANAFHEAWRPRLGLEVRPGYAKEHWTRVKALSRRLAMRWADHYDTLQPIADLRKELVDRIYVFVQSPLYWEGPEPEEEQKQSSFDILRAELSQRLLSLCSRRVWDERLVQWQDAYHKRGYGSTFVRARIIEDDIYELAAPVPDITPSPNRNKFLREVIRDFEATSQKAGAILK